MTDALLFAHEDHENVESDLNGQSIGNNELTLQDNSKDKTVEGVQNEMLNAIKTQIIRKSQRVVKKRSIVQLNRWP